MKQTLFFLLIISTIACRPEPATDQASTIAAPPLEVITDERPEWQYEYLRLYPILADVSFIQENAVAAELSTLSEALTMTQFRISEKMPYGRFTDRNAVNRLTVQNKTDVPVFLMSGEIVRGGKQDRVLSEDQIVAARSLQDIPVFCVERGRWQYLNAEEDAGPDSKVYAFAGYYQVAAGDIRHTLSASGDQEEVWEKVGRITHHHSSGSSTHAYAALETAEDFTRRRNAYLDFFADKFTELDQMVGIVAVSGDRVIAVDIFGHPTLMSRQLQPLLHSYITDALTNGSEAAVAPETVQHHLREARIGIERGERLRRYQGAIVHYYQVGTP